MAAIGRRRLAVTLAAFVLLPGLSGAADQATDVRARVNRVAEALSAGSPAEAMSVFESSCPQYEKIRQYFEGLADSFDVSNQLQITDEQESGSEATVTVDWDLTIADKSSDATEHRSGEITVKLKKSDKWKIISFGPIDIFNPAIRPVLKH